MPPGSHSQHVVVGRYLLGVLVLSVPTCLRTCHSSRRVFQPYKRFTTLGRLPPPTKNAIRRKPRPPLFPGGKTTPTKPPTGVVPLLREEVCFQVTNVLHEL